MYTINPGKTLSKFQSDINSVILTGKYKELQKNQYSHDHYSNKVKEIKALRKFEEIFNKEKANKTRKDLQTQLKQQSPHHLSNRLRGMFFLKKKLQLQQKYRESYDDDLFEDKLLEGKKIQQLESESPNVNPKQKSKLNFVNVNKTNSGKTLQKALARRPQTRIQSTICTHKKFNSQSVLEVIQIANKVKVIHHQSSFFYFNVYVEDGNNSQLIKNVIRKRPGWRVVETSNVANMIWSQFYRQALDFRQQRKIKQMELIKEPYQEKTYQPIKKLQNLHKTEIVKIQSRIGGRNHSQNNKDKGQSINFLKTEDYEKQVKKLCPYYENLQRKKTKQIHSNPSLHLYNHFPNHYCISDKNNLLHNLHNFYELRNDNVFDVIPFSIEVTKDMDLQSLSDQLKQGEHWIVKPGENSNRGRGIVVCRDIEAVIQDLKSRFQPQQKDNNTEGNQQKDKDKQKQKEECYSPSPERKNTNVKSILKTPRKVARKLNDEKIIVQRYIEPLLYNKRKFDIRMFLLVTGVKGKIRGYLYDEGYVRTCSKLFTFDNFNKYVHLTNDAIQYKSADYGKYEEGNKIGWKKFQNWLDSEGNSHYWPTFQKTTKRISRDILSSVKNRLWKKDYKSSIIMSEKKQIKNQSALNHTLSHSLNEADRKEDKIYYEVFGLDFLIGKDLKVWLIQINTNPSLNTECSRVVNNIIPKMIDNVFDIAVQPFTRSQKGNDTIKYENKFEAIYDDEWDELYRLKTKRDNQ